MALALDQARMIPSLPYKLDRIINFGLFVVMAIRDFFNCIINICTLYTMTCGVCRSCGQVCKDKGLHYKVKYISRIFKLAR